MPTPRPAVTTAACCQWAARQDSAGYRVESGLTDAIATIPCGEGACDAHFLFRRRTERRSARGPLDPRFTRRRPDLVISGYGGPKMREAGCRLDCELTNLAVMGVFQVMPLLWTFYKLVRQAERLVSRVEARRGRARRFSRF